MKKLLVVISFLILIVLIAILVQQNYFADRGSEPESVETDTAQAVSAETESVIPETETEQQTVGDITAPIISGLYVFVVHVGEQVDYLSHITVTDDTDPNPLLTVDDSRVNLDTAGSYIVIYKAEDASGNTSYAACDVRVVHQNRITEEQANEQAEELLEQLVDDTMSDREKLEAVWDYLHRICGSEMFYGDWDEILENSYHFLDSKNGGKRCVFAASKVLLENLGYDTVTVMNSEDALLTHYWNLVSCDGGESYYHFDPSVWSWDDDRKVFMVTDEWLWNYSADHLYRCYDWDTDYYPATPDTEF